MSIEFPASALTQKALVASESRYRRLFEAAQDGIILLNGETAVVEDVNPYMIAMLGFSHAQLVGKKLWELGAFIDTAKCKEMFAEILANGYVRYEDLPMTTAAGGEFEVEFVSNSYVCDNIKVIQCDIRDITARKLAEAAALLRSQELMESNIELERFAYVASHDLQTPLRNIIHFSQLLERRYKAKFDADGDQFIGFIVDGAKKMSALIVDILQYSRVRGGLMLLLPVQAGVALASALVDLEQDIKDADARVNIGDMPMVLADQPHLVSLFQNLLGNSLKYRKPGHAPTISVTAEPTVAHCWRFAVTDNGVGISPEYHDKIFEIFQRLYPGGETKGTGIGLTMCRHIVHRFGGTIWVESMPGKDTTFFFTLLDGSAPTACP
jgi:PAS domain S-box-containing protein